MLIHAIDAKNALSHTQLLAVIVSAVTHDVDHPGNTNLYEMNSESALAMLYNDHAVLENHHCATAFQIMRRPSNNILRGLTKPTAQVRPLPRQSSPHLGPYAAPIYSPM